MTSPADPTNVTDHKQYHDFAERRKRSPKSTKSSRVALGHIQSSGAASQPGSPRLDSGYNSVVTSPTQQAKLASSNGGVVLSPPPPPPPPMLSPPPPPPPMHKSHSPLSKKAHSKAPPPPPALPPMPGSSKAPASPSKGGILAGALTKVRLKKTASPASLKTSASPATALTLTKNQLEFLDRESPSLKASRVAVEATRPVKRHPANFRQFELKVDGNPVQVAILAHPEQYGSPFGDGVSQDTGIDSRMAFAKLIAGSYETVISLEKFEFDILEGRFMEALKGKGQIVLSHVEDFKAIDPKELESVYRIISRSASNGRNVALFCGAGFGRSGLLLASLKLRELVHEKGAQTHKDRASSGVVRSEEIKDIDGRPIMTTPLVHDAIEFVRTKDPENGNPLRAFNARSSLNGPSVENENQIRALEELESKLLRRQQG